jgi:hypothetical protein
MGDTSRLHRAVQQRLIQVDSLCPTRFVFAEKMPGETPFADLRARVYLIQALHKATK